MHNTQEGIHMENRSTGRSRKRTRRKKGGCGAVRQITEFILNARGDWDKIVNSYLQEGQGDAQ